MPARSEKQRKAMAIELAYRRKNRGKKRRFKSMTMKQLREFAKK